MHKTSKNSNATYTHCKKYSPFRKWEFLLKSNKNKKDERSNFYSKLTEESKKKRAAKILKSTLIKVFGKKRKAKNVLLQTV